MSNKSNANTARYPNSLLEGGRIVSVSGTPTGQFAEENELDRLKKILFSLASAKLTKLAKQYNVQYKFLFMKPSGEQLNVLTKLLEAEKIEPVIDTIYRFEDAQKALAYLEKEKSL